MKRLAIALFISAGLWFISSPAYASPGDWVNHAGPWFVPHNRPGNPALAYSIFTETRIIVGTSSFVTDPDQYGTFRSTDLGESWRKLPCQVDNS